MKKLANISCWIILLILATFSKSVEANDSFGYWELKGTWHSEIADVDPQHVNNTWEASASDGSITAAMTWKDNRDVKNPKIYSYSYAYTFSIQGTNQSGKQKLFPGDEVEINMTLSYQGIDPQILSGGARMYAGAFNNYPSDNLITVSNPGGSGSKTIKLIVPSGITPGTENYIKIHCEGGYQPIEFAYIYQWVKVDQTTQGDGKETTGAIEDSPKTADETTTHQSDSNKNPTSDPGYSSENEQAGSYPDQSPTTGKPDESIGEDSGARFDSVTGAVEICVDPDSDDWERCTPRTRIPVGAHIRARRDSSAIIRFVDANTFIIKENTEIVVKEPPKRSGKFGLIMGKLWSNTKKILTDGNIEIETSQAVAGIKGTTYVLEADVDKTVLKVIEGKVTFTSKVSGKTVDVIDGQMGIADNSDILAVESFDAQAEKEQWNKIISEAIAKKNISFLVIAGIISLLILGGSISIILAKVKKRRRTQV